MTPEEIVAGAAEAAPSAMNRIVEEAEALLAVQEEIREAEEHLKALKRVENNLAATILPDIMQSAGMGLGDAIDHDGWRIRLEDFVRGSFPKDPEKSAAAKEKLEEYGGEGILKSVVAVELPAGSNDLAEKVAANVRMYFGIPASISETVHPSTLAAFARERMKNGEEVDSEALGLFVQRRVKVRKA